MLNTFDGHEGEAEQSGITINKITLDTIGSKPVPFPSIHICPTTMLSRTFNRTKCSKRNVYDELSVSVIYIWRGHLMLLVKTQFLDNLGPLLDRQFKKTKCLTKKILV